MEPDIEIINIKVESLGLIDNLVTITRRDSVIIEKEIKGTMATKLFIEGFKQGIELFCYEVEYNEDINI